MSEILVNKLTGVGTAGSISVVGEGNSTTTSINSYTRSTIVISYFVYKYLTHARSP